LFQLILGALIDILGVVGNDGLGNGSSDSVDLSSNTSTLDSDADIQIRELVLTQDQDGFKDLQTKDFGLDVLNGLSIDLDESPTLLGECNSGCCLLPII
jgi:hypothetical protein